MLAFTRRPNESFLIGNDIVVKVLGRDDHGNIEFGIEGADDAECLNKTGTREPGIYGKKLE